ncbi:MAG: hypothetical protein AAF630_20175, partial [Cyanobacteria bacterium P01_C01_bin.38]
MVNEGGKTKQSRYNLFSVKVLQTFNTELQSRMSLDNWAYLKTKQNYVLALTEQIESYADAEIFQQAAEEIRAGQNRTMNSAYALRILRYV